MDSFEDAAEALFREFANRHSLLIEKETQDEIELSMTVPQQDGLSFVLYLGLQNGDEINIAFGDFWSCIFPFPSVKPHVEKLLDGIVTGSTRLVIKRQFGKTVVRKLEYLEGGVWRTGYRQICGIKIPFVPTQIEHFYNTG